MQTGYQPRAAEILAFCEGKNFRNSAKISVCMTAFLPALTVRNDSEPQQFNAVPAAYVRGPD